MSITHLLPSLVSAIPHAAPGLLTSLVALATTLVRTKKIVPVSLGLRLTSERIYRRMRLLGLNETQLSERCSLAGIHLFNDDEVPRLTRDRLSKILMNRQQMPAKSAARIITHPELTVLANVLKVSVEWLVGQEENRDPVVWNVLANPDRLTEFAHVLQAYEEVGNESKVWSRYLMHAYSSDAFTHAFNHAHYGRKPGIANPRSLVEFYNKVARIRRKRILRVGRPFDYTSLVYQSHFEHVVCGRGNFSVISKTILRRNIDAMLAAITNPALRIKLLIINDDYLAGLEAVRDYEILSTVDTLFSSWNYHNGDVGWSEHPSYVQSHRQAVDRMSAYALFANVNETVDYLKSLKSRLR
jgi:hypothetical protein